MLKDAVGRMVRSAGRLTAASDRKLALDFSRGGPGTFERIYERFRRPLLAMILRSVSDAAAAEDLIQEVFLKVHRFRDKYDPSYELSTWLWTIARNTVSDHLSRKSGIPSAAGEELDVHELPCPRGCAESKVIRKTERRRLLRIAARLPRLQRKALALRVLRGLSYDEIAARMRLSVSAVKSLLNRSKRSLIAQLECDPSLAPIGAAIIP